MIILNLVAKGKVQEEAMTRYLLQAKYAVQVVLVKPSTLIELDASGEEICTDIINIQFATKSGLINEIDVSLKKEFPQADFFMYASPAIHISTPFYEKIRSSVPENLSVNLLK